MFEELVKIVAKLRGPDGCPWDREQTRDTLKPYLVEEFYELIDALDNNDTEEMKEELGDLLFQIVLQSQLSDEEGTFNIDDVVAGISEKMVTRHPHVFGDKELMSSEARRKWWDKSKKKEGKNYQSAMDGVPRSLPALIRAQKLQMNATKVGFDWDNIEDVFSKVEEEIAELKEAIGRKKQTEIEDELGDIFFVLVRISNFVNVNPEDALRKTIRKFIYRFKYMEAGAIEQGRVLSDLSLAEMEVLWNDAKKVNYPRPDLDMKRVLFLSPFFYPEMISTGKYNTHLVKALVKRGCPVDVVASYPLYPDWKPEDSSADLAGCTVHRGGLWMRYPKSTILRRILLESWFLWHAAACTLRLRKKVDIVVSVFPPNFYQFLVSSLLPRNIRRIGIVHDLQGVMAKTKKTYIRKIIAGIMLHFEARAFKSCDELICMSETMRNVIVETYGISRNKCKVYFPFITESSAMGNTSELVGIMPEGFTHIVYSGALGEKQKPEFIIRLFEKLCHARDDVMCHIFSRGPLFDKMQKGLNKESEQQVRFHDLVPDEMLGKLFKRSFVQIIPQVEGTGAGAFPSKLPNLISAGVPVFVICDSDSELTKVVNETGIGKAVHKWDMDSCVREMNQFLESIKGESHEERYKRVKAYIDIKFNVEHVVDAIIGRE